MGRSSKHSPEVREHAARMDEDPTAQHGFALGAN